MKRILLIGCGKSKRTVPCPARELYIGPLFTARRQYAESTGCPWLIVSAKHWLLHPDQITAPYNRTVPTDEATAERWALCVKSRLCEALIENAWVDVGLTFQEEFILEIHAGQDYVRPLRSLFTFELMVTLLAPVEGLGIGQQLKFYKSRCLDCGGLIDLIPNNPLGVARPSTTTRGRSLCSDCAFARLKRI